MSDRRYTCHEMEVCPTEVVLAPAERIWDLLTDPGELEQWTGTKVVRGPMKPLGTGDHLVLRTGVLCITFDVLDTQPPRLLTLDVGLPFGVMNHEQIQIPPIDANSCRVTFN